MSTQGPTICGTGADDSSVGTVTWTTPGNITLDDSSYAGANGKNVTTHYLKATNFGFSIPSGATIDGITVEWKRKAFSATVAPFTDSSIKLVKGGTIGGTNNSAGATWQTAEGWVSFGGAADLWGQSWADTDINDSTFGVVMSAAIANGISTNAGSVNACRVTINYTGGSTTYTIDATAGSFTITGQAADILATRNIDLDAGSFTETGQSADIPVTRGFDLDAGSFALTGQNADIEVVVAPTGGSENLLLLGVG